MNKSFLGQSQSRGLRNNNPFNLIKTNIDWQGKIPNNQNTDGHFEQFHTVAWGLRAGYKDIMGDIQNKGQNTIRKLITAFAPAHENNTTAYINNVASMVGVSPDTVLTANKQTIIALAKAIVKVELGLPYANSVTEDIYNEAWGLLDGNFDAGVLGAVEITGSSNKVCKYCGHILAILALFFFTYTVVVI